MENHYVISLTCRYLTRQVLKAKISTVLKLYIGFQAEVFEKFLCGETLEQCYNAVASIADRWLDLLEVIRFL
jgi:hypothetical protein